LTVKSNAEAYFTVFVDGVRSETRYKVNAGTNDLVIANIPEAGDHTICVLKQTEAMNAICSFTKLNMVGHLSTEREPANRDLYIEFLGDSITCGYGNLCASNAENPGNAYNQDGTQSFAFLTAQALNADFSMVSCSGVGITNGYRPFTFDSFFAKHSYFRDQTTAYTPSRIPDLAVINLGTNDRTKGTDTAQYQTDVGELIDQVRAKYGADVPIVWITNMMNDAYYPQLLSAINGKGGASAGLYLALLNNNRDGGNGHPNLAAHQLASEKLIEFLETKNVLQ
jgi:lysophospholipase L1-like esterase